MGTKQIALIGLGASAVTGGIAGIYFARQNKTIKDKLTSKGIKLINNDANIKIWQLAWIEIKDDVKLNTVEATAKDHTTLKTYCTGAYDKPLEDTVNLGKVEKICTQPSLTIRERLKRKEKSLTKNWRDKLGKVKSENNLLTKLQSIDSQIIKIEENEVNQNALKGWCETRLDIDLTVEGTEYTEVEKLCV